MNVTHHVNTSKKKNVIAVDYMIDGIRVAQSYIIRLDEHPGVHVLCDFRKFEQGLVTETCNTETEARDIIEKNILLLDNKAVKKREFTFRVQ